ncbi:phage late control D family protein [Acetobacter sp. DsW_063]|uniref:phage late control D family protein n=1 Tax=Acetobacter sp. DsW_063 TaxID=1514894 RepID=UPI0011787B5F|nr:hypothetical protein [Acetobacter sp. DsW_063]
MTNGTALPDASNIHIKKTRLSESGTFSLTLPVEASSPYWFDPDVGTFELPIEVYLGFLPHGQEEGTQPYSLLFGGVVDHAHYTPAGNKVVVSGRDRSARLIERELSGKSFLNFTASDAISQLATEVGLTPDVDTTSGLVGQFYQYEHKAHGLRSMHRFQTAWDFCVGMQRRYGYDLWVDGNTLYFKAPDENSEILYLNWKQADSETKYPVSSVWNLGLSRRVAYSDGTAVTVSAWDARQRVSHSATYPSDISAAGLGYAYTAAVGTTLDECAALARQKYNETMAHARTLSMNVHPSLSISPRQRVTIQGTGTSFDGVPYTVDEVIFSVNGPRIAQSITLRNRSNLKDAS